MAARKDRIGNPKPGSIRYEARSRGVTEAFIRNERALAKGLTKSQARGHARVEKGERPLSIEKDLLRFTSLSKKRQAQLYTLMEKQAKKVRRKLNIFWTSMMSPGKDLS
jgi:hypothetical protein